MAIKALAFDIDGTLYPNWRMKFHSLPFLLRHFSLVMAFSRIRKAIRKKSEIVDFPLMQTGLLAAELKLSREDAADMLEDLVYTQWEKIFRRVKPYKGLQEVLGELKSRGYALGVLSDFPVGKKLDYFRLDGHWDVTMSSEETGYLKPHKASFLSLAEKLGCRPDEVIYIGNSYDYDVMGASATGMKTVYIDWKGKKIPEADLTIRNYRNFMKKIDFLLGEK